jgi:hypothetical protein
MSLRPGHGLWDRLAFARAYSTLARILNPDCWSRLWTLRVATANVAGGREAAVDLRDLEGRIRTQLKKVHYNERLICSGFAHSFRDPPPMPDNADKRASATPEDLASALVFALLERRVGVDTATRLLGFGAVR